MAADQFCRPGNLHNSSCGHLYRPPARFSGKSGRPSVDAERVHVATWKMFSIFIVVTLLMAESIPIPSATGYETVDQPSEERAGFLKPRGGRPEMLHYLSTAPVGGLLPYSTTHLFAERGHFNHVALPVFILCTPLSRKKILSILAIKIPHKLLSEFVRCNVPPTVT